MANTLKVTYIYHSGFLVETERSYLLFDYWKGEIPAMDYKKELYIFASHGHRDHFSDDIFKLENRCEKVQYILSSDIKDSTRNWAKAENVHFMAPHETLDVDGVHVETLFSTDEGVAFLVQADGRSIYHAGDLHWWHWPGEPEEDNEWHRKAFQKEMTYLSGKEFDCAFVVLDPRQEEAGERGMDYFLKTARSRYIFPMHCWNNYRMIREYKAKNDAKYLTGRIMEITGPGQEFVLEQ